MLRFKILSSNENPVSFIHVNIDLSAEIWDIDLIKNFWINDLGWFQYFNFTYMYSKFGSLRWEGVITALSYLDFNKGFSIIKCVSYTKLMGFLIGVASYLYEFHVKREHTSNKLDLWLAFFIQFLCKSLNIRRVLTARILLRQESSQLRMVCLATSSSMVYSSSCLASNSSSCRLLQMSTDR